MPVGCRAARFCLATSMILISNKSWLAADQEDLLLEMQEELKALLFNTVDAFMPVEEHIKAAGQSEEWFVREEHFHGGFNF